MSTTQPPTPGQRAISSPLLITAAWLVVGLPAAWGIYRTLATATRLFTAPSSAAVQPHGAGATSSAPATPTVVLPTRPAS